MRFFISLRRMFANNAKDENKTAEQWFVQLTKRQPEVPLKYVQHYHNE